MLSIEQANQGYLAEVDILCDLTPDEIETLGQRAPMRAVPAGTTFYRAGDTGEVLFILKVGRVRLYHLSPDGKAFTVALIEDGTIFGEMAMMGQLMHDSYAESLSPCTLCLISRTDVQTLLLGDPRIARRIAEILGRRLLDAEQRLADFAFKAQPQRLATLLASLADRQPPRLFHAGQREIRLTHEQIADLVGTHRETATKILNELRDAGLIELKRGRVIVLNSSALRIWGS